MAVPISSLSTRNKSLISIDFKMDGKDALRTLKIKNCSFNSTYNITWLSLMWGHLAAAFLTKKATRIKSVVNPTHVGQPPDPELFGGGLLPITSSAQEPLRVGELLHVRELGEAVCKREKSPLVS